MAETIIRTPESGGAGMAAAVWLKEWGGTISKGNVFHLHEL
jgi:hypothetical protein